MALLFNAIITPGKVPDEPAVGVAHTTPMAAFTSLIAMAACMALTSDRHSAIDLGPDKRGVWLLHHRLTLWLSALARPVLRRLPSPLDFGPSAAKLAVDFDHSSHTQLG